MSSLRSRSLSPHRFHEVARTRRLCDTSITPASMFPDARKPDDLPPTNHHLPFKFGAEFEVIMRPKCIADLVSDLELPSPDASAREARRFHNRLLVAVASLLSKNGMPASYLDPSEDEAADYSKWNVMMDASVSTKHVPDGFYPMEIVTPVIVADKHWPRVVDQFFCVLRQHFDLRRDTSCGFHVHVSFATGSYSLEQLRSMAKAVAFWEPATARCAPPSRQDNIQGFCKSIVEKDGPLARDLASFGPLRGLSRVFGLLDHMERDDIVSYICPDKYRSWNFRPSKVGGPGSIEFRRPPGVVTAKKAKHWIAFAMTFLDMAVQYNPERLARRVDETTRVKYIYHPDFEEQFIKCARRLGTYFILDARLQQSDEPRSLYTSNMGEAQLSLLRSHDPDYGFPR